MLKEIVFARFGRGTLFEQYMSRKLLGTSETLIGTDTEPYLFRASPSLGDYNAEHDEIVGVSVGFNQLAEEINSTDWSAETGSVTVSFSDGVATISAPANYGILKDGRLEVLPSRKYLLSYQVKGSAGQAERMSVASKIVADHTIVSANTWETVEKIASPNAEGSGFVYLYGTGSAYTDLSFRNVMLIDLTAMLGSTIADYIYTLEQGTAGAGVSFFKKYFGSKDYYAYDSGSIKSVEGLSAHEMVGFNQWDEEWALGYWNSNDNGAFVANNNFFACKNKIRVFPNTTYFWQSPVVIRELLFYDANENYISKRSEGASEPYSFTTPSNCCYATFYYASAYGNTYNHDICINLSSADNGQYKPYEKHSYSLDSTKTLRGLLKLDGGKLKADGDVYKASGEVVRNWGEVDLGSLEWTYRGEIGAGVFATSSVTDYMFTDSVSAVCGKYNYIGVVGSVATMTNYDKAIAFYYASGTSSRVIYVRDTAYTDKNSFTTAMAGQKLVYELATPTTETAQPYAKTQKVSPSGTEEYVSTGVVPVGHNTEYVKK